MVNMKVSLDICFKFLVFRQDKQKPLDIGVISRRVFNETLKNYAEG